MSIYSNKNLDATDHCGNVATASQVITVSDDTPPSFQLVPADVTVTCNDIPVFDPLDLHFGDNCDDDLTITHNDVQTGTGCPFTITRTFTITDDCGNVATATQLITVNDNEAPVLVGVPGNVNSACGTIPAPATCLLYTSPSPRDATLSRMPSSA